MTISDVIQERLRQIKPYLEEQFEMELTAQAYDVVLIQQYGRCFSQNE